MVRTDEWKYVHRHPDGPHELYRVAEDAGEQRNLAADPACRERMKELRGRIEDWFARYSDPARDGRVQPVTGSGQGGLVGGAESFF